MRVNRSFLRSELLDKSASFFLCHLVLITLKLCVPRVCKIEGDRSIRQTHRTLRDRPRRSRARQQHLVTTKPLVTYLQFYDPMRCTQSENSNPNSIDVNEFIQTGRRASVAAAIRRFDIYVLYARCQTPDRAGPDRAVDRRRSLQAAAAAAWLSSCSGSSRWVLTEATPPIVMIIGRHVFKRQNVKS